MNSNWAAEEQFPWQVSIKTHTHTTKYAFCSGAALNNQWVLTSASCVLRAIRYEIRHSSLLHYTGGQVVVSHEAYIHPFFNETNNQNNVALIFAPVSLSSTKWLEVLPPQWLNADLTYNRTVVSGWGRLTGLQEVSPVLQFARGEVISNTSTACIYNFNYSVSDRNDLLCAHFSGQKNCAGDTGSPLIVNINRKWYLAGVAVFNTRLYNCQSETSLFTPVYAFHQWLVGVTGSTK